MEQKMEKDFSDYQVFINHRGPDTRNTLASLLYSALSGVGLHVFLDLKEHPTGNPVSLSPETEAAINTSSVQIAIFSPRYAESLLCLEELCLILQQREQRTGITIIPIFCDVKFSDLKHLNEGPYAEAFTKHKDRGTEEEELERWKKALIEAADIERHEFDKEKEDWGKFVYEIVGIVLNKVGKEPLVVAEKPVGLDKAANNLYNEILKQMEPSADTTIVGIAGLGGSGKTTLATHLYNMKCSQFKRSSFLYEFSRSTSTSLQEKLLFDLLGCPQLHIGNKNEGNNLLQQHLRGLSRVLIVLDGIENQEQIDNLLLVVKDVLADGSLIVITSRDKDLLARCQVNFLYEMKLLDENDSRELFCQHAFHTSKPATGFADMVRELVKICGGYPFALEVLGGLLFGKQKRNWKVLLKNLQKNEFPEEIVQKILKTSYNSLEKEEKVVFLDVACFFDELDVQLVARMHGEVECPLLDYIETLGQKCLVEFQRVEVDDHGQIKYDDGGHEDFCIEHWIGPRGRSKFMSTYKDCKIGMHKFVKDMAKKIASEERDLCESCTENQMISLDYQISDWVQLPKGTTARGTLRRLIVVDDCIQEFPQLNFLKRSLRRLWKREASYSKRQELPGSSAQLENLETTTNKTFGGFIEVIQGKKGKESAEYSPIAGIESFNQYRPPLKKLDPIQHRKRYDVYLSFYGPDVRNTLANKLFLSLQHAGLHVFLDSERLEKEENIGISLEEAMKDSRLFIPIFSPQYANSAWCLGDLSLMLRCKAMSAGTKIIPLFYNVEPLQVGYPDYNIRTYAEALAKRSGYERHGKEIEEWEAALHEVASLSGWDLAQAASGDDDKLVQQVTEDLQKYIFKDLHVAKHPVGLAARSIEVVKELRGIADHQRRSTIGIWGMGGSGKTTLSKSVYNHIYHEFQASCFVADIRATVSAMGLSNLQKHVLKDLTRHDVDLCSVDRGKIEMQNRLASIKALVILDDVDDDEQLDALLGDWYGPGSIVIITTRDKEVLQRSQIDKIQAMGGLSPEEGVELFSRHVFGRESPEKDYEDMTQQIVHACDGLPLSLEILGAHLRSEKNLTSWEQSLQDIQNVGYDKLYKSLRISYDALTFHEKQIFLDIACFFTEIYRWSFFSKEFYMKFWEVLGRKVVPKSLENLERKSLIVVHEDTYIHTLHGRIACEFRMHDHLRDLGRQIVEEESPDNPHIRSRLWRKEDIVDAIDQAEETSTVQGITWRGTDEFEVEQVDSLSSMHNLKFMFCWDLFLKGEITELPKNLRYLVLSECTLEHHRSFSEMPSSTENYLSFCFSMPKEIGRLKHLRYLDMSGTPLGLLPIEFGQLLSLEELYMIGCSLIELPHSFGNLIKLKFLDISRNCLKSFPANFNQLRSLEFLYARRNEFEELAALPGGLFHLDVSYSGRLKCLPPISHIANLHIIKLCGCRSLTELPSMYPMSNLETLDLSGCRNLVEIPNLDGMHCLRELILDDCWSLENLPALPAGPIHVSTAFCWNVEKLQNNSSTDQRKHPASESKNEIPLLDLKRRRVTEQSIPFNLQTSEESRITLEVGETSAEFADKE